MDEVQTPRASLADKQVLDEDCFIVLEPNPLGFQVHLREGMMTQQDRQLPGHIQQFLPPSHFPCLWPWPLTPAVLVIYSPEQLSEVERSS